MTLADFSFRAKNPGPRRRADLPLLASAGVLVAYLVVQVPFLATAFRIDEPNIIEIARRISAEPTDPYGFTINWLRAPEPAFEILANPPLVPYWIATWASMFGWSETSLHLGMLPFSIASLLGVMFAASHFGFPPYRAALLAIGSPVFFLSSPLLMPDVAALALVVWAVVGALRYVNGSSPEWAWLAIAAGFLAPIAKYNAIVVLPIVAGVVVLHGRRSWLGTAVAGAPLAGLVTWSFVSWLIYGRVHFFVASAFQGGWKFHLDGVLVAFGIGVVPLALGIAPWRKPRPAELPALIVVLGTLFAVASVFSGYSFIPAAVFAVSATLGARFLLLAALDLPSYKGRGPVILLAWILISFVMQFAALFVAARYMLPMLPAVVIAGLYGWRAGSSRLFSIAVAASLLLAFSVAVADARHADLYRTAVREQIAPIVEAAGGDVYFSGYWGFYHYMREIGATPLNPDSLPQLSRGDILVFAEAAFPQMTASEMDRLVAVDRRLVLQTGLSLKTIDCLSVTNFHGGPLRSCQNATRWAVPMAFSSEPSDRIHILEVR